MLTSQRLQILLPSVMGFDSFFAADVPNKPCAFLPISNMSVSRLLAQQEQASGCFVSCFHPGSCELERLPDEATNSPMMTQMRCRYNRSMIVVKTKQVTK